MAQWIVFPRVKRNPVSGDITGVGMCNRDGDVGVSKSAVNLRTIVDGWRKDTDISHLTVIAWTNTGLLLPANWFWFDTFEFVRIAIRGKIAELKPDECKRFVTRFGPKSLRMAESHAEVAIASCSGGELRVAMGSGGLWPSGDWSGVLEWHLADTRPEVAAWWLAWFDALPVMPIASAEPPRQRTLGEIMGGWS